MIRKQGNFEKTAICRYLHLVYGFQKRKTAVLKSPMLGLEKYMFFNKQNMFLRSGQKTVIFEMAKTAIFVGRFWAILPESCIF